MTPVSVGHPRILAIEDDPVLGAHMREHLSRCGFQVTCCQDGKEGLTIAPAQTFDAVLMDILRRVALDHRSVPTMLQSEARGLGFDDELCDVRYAGHWAGLTRSEYRLLETLNRKGDEVLSKAFLYQQVLQRDYASHDRSLDMHISQIRRKLKAIGYSEREVRTVWGKGYVLSAIDETSERLPGPVNPHQQLLRDLSRELREPLNRLRVASDSEQDLTQLRECVVREVDNMQRLVEGWLQLAWPDIERTR